MKKVAKNLIGLIGHTPLMELSGYSAKYPNSKPLILPEV